jgi:hypothetical protein
MKLSSIGVLCASVIFVTGFQAVAQDAPALPKVLRIIREEVKQGKDAAHEKTEANFAKLAAKHKFGANYLGCNVVAGPSDAWFFEAHDSFKAIQNTDDARAKNPAMKADLSMADGLDGELRSSSSTMIAILRDDLSYRASQFAQELPKTRYFNMTIARLRPFTDMRFAELGKQIIAANEKANIDLPTAIYQVVSGGPTGMYLIFQPMKSMETMDSVPARSAAMMQAMGMDKITALYKNAGEVITGTQTFLLAINPKMSYVGKDIADQDPDFWTPKPAMTAKPPAAKSPEKTGGGQ